MYVLWFWLIIAHIRLRCLALSCPARDRQPSIEAGTRVVERCCESPGPGHQPPGKAADLDTLVSLLPSLAGLSQQDRQSLIGQARLVDAPSGATIIQRGEMGEAGFFLLSGKAVAGVATGKDSYTSFSNLKAGDYFGEIEALSKRQKKQTSL